MNAFLAHLRISLTAMVLLAIIVCGAYPAVVWGIAQVAFPARANGSLVTKPDGTVVGSSLMGQPFGDPRYFHPRPSAAGNGYDPTSTGGTNLGPTSDKLINGVHKKTADGKDDPNNADGVKDLVAAYRTENSLDAHAPVPIDAVTRSASGVDPDISIANADIQAARVAKARGMSVEAVLQVVGAGAEGPLLGFIGVRRVNVLRLNLALDQRH